ncbi:MAG: rhodanese-like domain-containing protein [Burkholderiales bacterium]|nr:MAG: rhodanese-like domain-containing protein [Burkholderiales bacterium]
MTTIQFLRSLCAFALCTFAAASLAGGDISAAEAHAGAKAGKFRLIDIRTPQEWRQTGIAPGAAQIDFYRGSEVLVREVTQIIGGDKNAPIALICRTGNRTTQAQRILQAQGFTQVFNVKEGMAGSSAGPGWLKQGLPIEACTKC